MLDIEILSCREAVECDYCDEAYKQRYGCPMKSETAGTMEILACRIEHTIRRRSG